MKHALVVLAALILGMSTAAYADPDPALSGLLLRARQWLNTQPLLTEVLRGKVILVNFWTYSCINSLIALPHFPTSASGQENTEVADLG
jgi:thiol-disulfide isomerase/thioredoxin